MKQLQLFISSIFVIFGCAQVYGQDTTTDTTSLVDSGVSFYLDYGKLLTLPLAFEMKAEAGMAFRLKNRFSPNLQIGMAKLEPSGAIENGSYLSEGIYGRVGLNYLIPFDAVNTLYAGVKYSMSMYEEKGSYEITSNLWPQRIEGYQRQDLQASWFEVIFGSEKKLSKKTEKTQKLTNWSIGGYFSLRVLSQRDEFEMIDTYAIPGYGRAFDKTVPAINVYIRYGF